MRLVAAPQQNSEGGLMLAADVMAMAVDVSSSLQKKSAISTGFGPGELERDAPAELLPRAVSCLRASVSCRTYYTSDAHCVSNALCLSRLQYV